MSRLSERVKTGVFCVFLFGFGACGGGSGGGGGNGGAVTTCPTGEEGCPCYPNKTCNSPTLSCLSLVCVTAGTPGGGGALSSGGTLGSGGGPGAGGAFASGGSTGAGGSVALGGAPGSGGSTVLPGTGGAVLGGALGSGGAPGTGGAATSGGAPGTGGSGGSIGGGGAQDTGGVQGTGGATASGGKPGTGGTDASGGTSGGGGSVSDGCNNAAASVLDNFATCDASICNLGGRNGTWFSYSSNTNIGIQCSASVPPVSWIDRSCGYYCTNGVAGASWAGAGFDLKEPSGAYDLSGYTGVHAKVETGQSLTLAIKDLGGGMWRSASIGGGSGAVTYTIPFGTMTPDSGTSGSPNLSQIVGFRFDVDPKSLNSFGFAIHMITLY